MKSNTQIRKFLWTVVIAMPLVIGSADGDPDAADCVECGCAEPAGEEADGDEAAAPGALKCWKDSTGVCKAKDTTFTTITPPLSGGGGGGGVTLTWTVKENATGAVACRAATGKEKKEAGGSCMAKGVRAGTLIDQETTQDVKGTIAAGAACTTPSGA